MLDLVVGLEAHDLALFRGQRKPWPLLPKIARRINPRVKDTPVLDLERRMFKEFRWRALPHTQGMGDDDWGWLALAQHYGLATRLLDWTTNPLAALWFAVREAPPHRRSDESDKPGIVWMLFPDEEDYMDGFEVSPFEVRATQVFRPTRITPRIIVQSGWFTVHMWMPEEKSFISLESDGKYKKKISRINVPKALFGGIREELARLDIHSASMFPDLGGLGSYVEWLYIKSEDG
jgi:FRG domain